MSLSPITIDEVEADTVRYMDWLDCLPDPIHQDRFVVLFNNRLFKDLKMRDFEFERSIINKCRFENCEINLCDFYRATICECEFVNCRIIGSSFSHAFINSKFTDCDFSDSSLHRTMMGDSVFVRCNFQGTEKSYLSPVYVRFENCVPVEGGRDGSKR